MHTPGPWKCEIARYNDYQGHEILTDDRTIAVTLCEDPVEVNKEELANALLIAAAPELLEAAQLVIDSWSSGDLAAAVRQLADAVAEATCADPTP